MNVVMNLGVSILASIVQSEKIFQVDAASMFWSAHRFWLITFFKECIGSFLEGTRPLMIEIQSYCSTTPEMKFQQFHFRLGQVESA
jgi:hypothetical protein